MLYLQTSCVSSEITPTPLRSTNFDLHLFRKLRHASNERMCVPCGTFNHAKRHQTCDGAGKVAMVTGGRIKIGYETVLSLLRKFYYLAQAKLIGVRLAQRKLGLFDP